MGNVRKEGGLVALAAHGNGREVRGVGFEEKTVERKIRGNGAKGVGVAKGGDAGKADVKSAVKAFAGKGNVAGKTMDDARNGGLLETFVEDGKGVVVGFAGVDDEGQGEALAERNHLGEERKLGGTGVRGVVVVEAGFSKRAKRAWRRRAKG